MLRAALSLAVTRHVALLDLEVAAGSLLVGRYRPWAVRWLPRWCLKHLRDATMLGFRRCAVELDWALECADLPAPWTVGDQLLRLAVVGTCGALLDAYDGSRALPAVALVLGVTKPLAAQLWARGAEDAEQDPVLLYARGHERFLIRHWFTPPTVGLAARDGITFERRGPLADPKHGVPRLRLPSWGTQLGVPVPASDTVARARAADRAMPGRWVPKGTGPEQTELAKLCRRSRGQIQRLHWQPLAAGDLRYTPVTLHGYEIDSRGQPWLLAGWQGSLLAIPLPSVVSVEPMRAAAPATSGGARAARSSTPAHHCHEGGNAGS